MNNLRIICVGKIVSGPIEWKLPVKELPSQDFWWEGYVAQRDGKPLAAMPTERHEAGWWQAHFERGEADRSRFDGSIEDDADFIRHGGA